MKKLINLIFFLSVILIGCQQDTTEKNLDENSTKERVYSSNWDGTPVIVIKRNENGTNEKIREITDTEEVATLINELKNADWEENVVVDISPPDYTFTWNSFKHSVWINEEYEYKRIELKIDGQSNWGTLSKKSSEIVYEILIGVDIQK
ncbi:hypothetical protein JOC95_001541 [Bacillus tianshenii]|uniref:Lipoprotein n=1 Tax=Sutcliffiella tianshenii TaxID=1463404 RepID=A0ABS2NYK0_9BACI|nr:hypothetical protein [Bacillus tianshenii]MBM7619689.1 hypothetical protein [Bacillus tianshenii]